MAKKLNIQLKTHWKERMVEYNVLRIDNWEPHKEIVAAHHTHKLLYSIEETTERENTTECIVTVPEIITHLSEDSNTLLKDYDVNIYFPILICNDDIKVHRIIKAIEESVQITSKNWFSSETYSPVEVIKTFLSCEINEAYSKAIWRKNQSLVEPNLSQPHYVVQLFTDAEQPVSTMWTENNVYPLYRK